MGTVANGEGKSPTHTYRKTGIFTAILKVTDNKGQVESTTKEIVVYSKPTARFSSLTTTGIAPLKVNFNASASNDSGRSDHRLQMVLR